MHTALFEHSLALSIKLDLSCFPGKQESDKGSSIIDYVWPDLKLECLISNTAVIFHIHAVWSVHKNILTWLLGFLPHAQQ